MLLSRFFNLLVATISVSSAMAQSNQVAINLDDYPIPVAETPNYHVATEKVLIRPAYQLNEIEPPTWKTVKERILVCPAYPEGSTFTTLRERVRLRDPYSTIEVVPPVWDATDKIIITQENCKNSTQETKTYTRYTLVTPALVRETNTLGEYKFILRKTVEKRGAGKMIDAEYIEVEKQAVDMPPLHKVTTVPAEYQTFEIKRCR
jgi:hypothetical protein